MVAGSSRDDDGICGLANQFRMRLADTLLRFVNEDDSIATDSPQNPHGSLSAIGGITDPTGRILGLMPHPDRSYLPYQHPQRHRREITEHEMGGATLFQHLVWLNPHDHLDPGWV